MTFVNLAKEADVPEGSMISLRTKTDRIALAKINGKIFAFEDVCTHDNGTLSGGSINNGCVVCPRHGARFDLTTGEVLQLPATEGIEIYDVKIENGDVLVNIN
jgi:3-phenylpropionate/trans-cinnamate dioxygenase ferredoxin subunit